jgi:hypothetical protein
MVSSGLLRRVALVRSFVFNFLEVPNCYLVFNKMVYHSWLWGFHCLSAAEKDGKGCLALAHKWQLRERFILYRLAQKIDSSQFDQHSNGMQDKENSHGTNIKRANYFDFIEFFKMLQSMTCNRFAGMASFAKFTVFAFQTSYYRFYIHRWTRWSVIADTF